MSGNHTSHVPLLPPSPDTHPRLFSSWGAQLRETPLWEERTGVTEPPNPKSLGYILPLASAAAPAPVLMSTQ